MLIEGYNFTSNLGFVGSKLFFVIFQYIQSFVFILIFLIYFVIGSEVFHISELLFPVLAVITRSLIIAIRYGYMSKTRYSVCKLKQTLEWITDDLILLQWGKVSFASIESETKASKYRMKVENDDFMFQFMTPLDKDDHDRFSNPDFYKEKNIKVSDIVKEYKAKKKLAKQKEKERIKPSVSPAPKKTNASIVINKLRFLKSYLNRSDCIQYLYYLKIKL